MLLTNHLTYRDFDEQNRAFIQQKKNGLDFPTYLVKVLCKISMTKIKYVSFYVILN